MPFDHCKVCRKCCHVDEGYPALEIPLLPAEKRRWRELVIESQCQFLSLDGCKLGHDKPFACEQYPLSFDPVEDRYYFDADCPIYQQYQHELSIEGSEAQQHFRRINKRLKRLKEKNPEFLKRNFDLDADYFELLELAVPKEVAESGKD